MPLSLVPDRAPDDWDRLVHALPGRAPRHAVVRLSDPHEWDRPLPGWASGMGRLLGAARVTPVTLDGASYELLGWERRDGGRTGWLCPLPPARAQGLPVYEHHAELLETFGGVVDCWHAPPTWLESSAHALTAPLLPAVASMVRAERWRWAQRGLTLPIDPDEWYAVSAEADGGATLCHRSGGDVLQWSPDSRHDLRPLEDCPEGTLYRIDGTPDFCFWVEQLALQWLGAVVA